MWKPHITCTITCYTFTYYYLYCTCFCRFYIKNKGTTLKNGQDVSYRYELYLQNELKMVSTKTREKAFFGKNVTSQRHSRSSK